MCPSALSTLSTNPQFYFSQRWEHYQYFIYLLARNKYNLVLYTSIIYTYSLMKHPPGSCRHSLELDCYRNCREVQWLQHNTCSLSAAEIKTNIHTSSLTNLLHIIIHSLLSKIRTIFCLLWHDTVDSPLEMTFLPADWKVCYVTREHLPKMGERGEDRNERIKIRFSAHIICQCWHFTGFLYQVWV